MVGTMDVDTSGSRLGDRVAALKAVADPTRLQVLDLLSSAGPRCHCELEEELTVPANRLSFHLRILRDAGLVTTRRRGKRVEYQLDPVGVRALQHAIPVILEEVAG
jgi:ArsR family transcriptional regulator, arsenate/arsenite/antimonite-responsive transcriptional repressor